MAKINSSIKGSDPIHVSSKRTAHECFKNAKEVSETKITIRHPKSTKQSTISELKALSGLALYFLKKFWMSCSTAFFVIFVIFWCYGSIFALILFLFALSGFLFQVGDLFLYHPDQPPRSRLYVPLPSLFGLPYESIFLKTVDGVKLHAFLIKQDQSIISHVPTVIYFHGNAGNIGDRLQNAQGLYQHCGYNVFLVEYRGYGHSEGVQSEEGLYLDAQAGLEYLLQLPYIDKNKIIAFGRSLGGAVAIDLASHAKYGKHIFVLMVENTFTSIPDIARETFNWRLIHMLPIWAFKNQFLSMEKIKNVKRPSLFISGQADLIVPPKMMRLLIKASGSCIKRLIPFEFGSHNETWQCQGYYEAINMFVDDVLLIDQDSQVWSASFDSRGEIY